MTLLFGGGMTLFGVVFFFKKNFQFMTRYKKKSLGGKVVKKVKQAVKKKN